MNWCRLTAICVLVFSLGGWRNGTAPITLGTFDLKIGAGGWLVGIDVNPDGTRLARTDTYGAYIWRTSGACAYSGLPAPCWDQLKVQSSMPASHFGYVGSGTSQVKFNGIAGGGGGVYEIASAPSNSSIIFMMVDGWIFKSTDKGATFNVTGTGSGTFFNSASTPVSMGSNSTSRQCGRKMAVDPINPSIVYAGTDVNGMFVTSDGGASWSAVSGVPTGTGVVNYNIAFDPTSGSGGTTQTIYAATNGSTAGVYVSTNAGSSWTLTSSGPSTVCHMVVDQTGVVWATDGANGGANGSLWRYNGTWVKLTAAGSQLHSVAVDPTDATHVVVVSTGGVPATTINATAGTPTWTITGTISRVATDIPWLAAVNENFMSNGDTIFDPTNCTGGAGNCTLVFGEGIGVWTSSPPNSTANVAWTSVSAGIEQLVSRDVIAPNGVAVTGVSDRSTFYLPSPNTYPSNYVAPYHDSFSLNVTWALDWATSNTNFMAAVTGDINSTTNNNSGFSTDGGQTWKQFNSDYQDIAGNSSTITNNGSGLVRITLPTTTGLNSWTAGTSDRTTIVRVISYSGAVTTLRRYWEITVVDGTHIDLIGSTFASNMQAGRYDVYVDTNPLTDNNALFTVTGTASGGGGRVKLTVTSTSSAMADNTIVCVTGVGGTTEANGCWTSTGTNNGTNSFELTGSTYVNAWTSGGKALKTIPPGGSVAASTPNNIIMVGGNQDFPQCTTDGGLTWTPFNIGSSGWVNASFLNRRILAADRVTANTFYMYNSSTGTYLVTNCDAPTLQSSTLITNGNFNATMRSVPGYAGHLFFAIGPQGSSGPAVLHPQGGALKRSTDGGTTWQSIATTAEPLSIAVGAIGPGSDYPTIYMAGWISNVYGIWRTTATAAQWASGSGTGTSVTWTKVNDYPLGSMDGPGTLGADQTTWNKWMAGFGGSAFVYGKQNYLLNRDLHHDNDNTPAFLEHVA